MRVVIDTNVLVSAAVVGRDPEAIILLYKHGGIQLLSLFLYLSD